MGWNEASMHRWLRLRLAPAGLRNGYGSDAAALARSLARPVLCLDQTVEGVHFLPGAAPRWVGHKACARSLSDLAASAARPRAVLAGLCAPSERDERWLRAVLTAIARTARAHGAELVGGDLACASGPAAISVCALGELSVPRAPSRDRARPGDLVLLTGAVGGSGGGRHLRIRPRVAEGLWLAARGARAMMDVSDGLALDLSRLAALSGVRIDLERVPVHRDAVRAARAGGASAFQRALHEGEDHELIAVLPPSRARAALERATRSCPGLQLVGRVRAGKGLYLPASQHGGELTRWTGAGGWIHGG